MQKFKSILLIDDDKATNYIHSLYLNEWDCTENIYTALNGQEALDFLKSNEEFQANKPSLILLDINMPVMNGFEFMEKYKTLDEDLKATIVVVMLTSSLHEADQERASQLDDLRSFMHKPLSKEQMQAVMAKLIAENVG